MMTDIPPASEQTSTRTWLAACRAAFSSRLLAVDMAAHGVADRLDVLRDRSVAAFAQPRRIGSERRKRRLEPMGEIGGASARAFDLPLMGGQQGIDFLDQRPDLARHRRRHLSAFPGPDVGNAAAQRVERPQAEADLDRGGDGEDDSEEAERDRQVLGEGGRSRRHAREIGCDRDPHPRPLFAHRERDDPLRDEQARPLRPRYLMTVGLARRRLVGRQRHGGVPRRARAHELAAAVLRLPVESRQGVGKARIGGRARHHQAPLGIDVEARQQLTQMDVEVVGQAAGDVPLEQQDQCGAGDRERRENCDDAPRHQPQPQRGSPHATGSGTV